MQDHNSKSTMGTVKNNLWKGRTARGRAATVANAFNITQKRVDHYIQKADKAVTSPTEELVVGLAGMINDRGDPDALQAVVHSERILGSEYTKDTLLLVAMFRPSQLSNYMTMTMEKKLPRVRRKVVTPVPDSVPPRSLLLLIMRELRIALWTSRTKYRKESTALKKNADLLIGAVAGYVAASAGIAVAVIAALVAALLRLALAIGKSAFCAKMEELVPLRVPRQ